jgi:hypothetical protein
MAMFSTNKKTDGKSSISLPNFGNLPSCYIKIGQNNNNNKENN